MNTAERHYMPPEAFLCPQRCLFSLISSLALRYLPDDGLSLALQYQPVDGAPTARDQSTVKTKQHKTQQCPRKDACTTTVQCRRSGIWAVSIGSFVCSSSCLCPPRHHWWRDLTGT